MTTTDDQTILDFDGEAACKLRRDVQDYVRDVAIPNGAAWEAMGYTPHDAFRELGKRGLLGLRHSPEYGGRGLGPVASVIFSEEINRCTYSGMPEAVLIHTDMSSTHIAFRGTAEQKQKYLPAMIRGELICGIAVTEPGAGSDVARLSTRAEKRAAKNGGGYVLYGRKTFATNAVHGDVMIIAARTDLNPDTKASRAVSLFLVDTNLPGMTITSMGRKHGMHASDIADITFDGLHLPASALIGEENRGFRAIMENFQDERLVLAAMCIGMARAAIDTTLAHVRGREAFGGTLWDLPTTRQRLAMFSAQINAARALTYETAIRLAKGQDCVREVSMVKPLAAEALQDVMRGCLQLHGGVGYMHGSVIERIGRDARLMTLGGGATEVLLEEVAKRM